MCACLQALPTARVPLLGRYLQQVGGLTEAAMRAYIEQQVDYFKFTRVLELSRVSHDTGEELGYTNLADILSCQGRACAQTQGRCREVGAGTST